MDAFFQVEAETDDPGSNPAWGKNYKLLPHHSLRWAKGPLLEAPQPSKAVASPIKTQSGFEERGHPKGNKEDCQKKLAARVEHGKDLLLGGRWGEEPVYVMRLFEN